MLSRKIEHREACRNDASLRIPILALCILGVVALVTIAVLRRPNFDEWLVLRAGWLVVNRESSGLHFLMPFTWLAGMLTAAFSNVVLPALVLRLFVVTTVLLLLWWGMQKQLGDAFSTSFAFFLCLVSGVFVSHAIEFRYDAVILLCWLWCWGIASRNVGQHECLLLGLACALLALHHTKGLFYAGSLALYVGVSISFSLKLFGRFALGIILITVPWLLILLINGLVEEQLKIYQQFSTLAMESARVSVWDALAGRLSTDAFWWLLVVPAAILGLLRRVVEKRRWISSVFFAAVPLSFVFLHPHPWDYLIVPIIPFLCTFAAEGSGFVRERLPVRAQTFIAVLLVPALLISVAGVYIQSLQAKAVEDVHLLREISRQLRHDDKVVDPTGAAYFISPLDPEWYLDSLFRDSLANGRWMRATVSDFQNASIVIASYRLGWIEDVAPVGLSRSHERVCGWLWMRRGDDRIASLRQRCGSPDSEVLLNFWGR